jgi:Emfourin
MRKTKKVAALGTNSVISIAREGGFAFIPGLAKPRNIALSECTEDERTRIAELIRSAAALAVAQAGRGDERYYRIEIHTGPSVKKPVQAFLLAEKDAPDELIKLWEKATEAIG